MNAWDWFKQHGDKLFLFFTLECLWVQTDPQIAPHVPPVLMHVVVFLSGSLAIAHKVFFPTTSLPAAPPINPTQPPQGANQPGVQIP